MQPTLDLYPAQLAQVASYFRTHPDIARGYGLAPAEAGVPLPNKPETYTYQLGAEPTPGRGYDDRLTVRLGLSRSKIMEELALWYAHAGRRGGLRSKRIGTKHSVSELACREYMGDASITQAT